MNATTERNQRRGLSGLLALLGANRAGYLVAVVVLAATYTFERLFLARVARVFVDSVAGRDLAALKSAVIACVIFYPIYMAFIPLPYRAWQMAIYRATAGLRERLFGHLQRLPLSYHESHHTGDALSIMSNDLTVVEDAYRVHFWGLVHGILQGVAAATAMLLLDTRLALLTIASGIVVAATNAAFANPLRRAAKAAQERLGGMTERFSDLLAGFEVVRCFGLGRLIVGRFDEANDEARNAGLRRTMVEAEVSGANELAMGFFFMPVIVGAYWMLTGRVSYGTVIAMWQLCDGVNTMLKAIGASFSKFQNSLAAADRIRDVLGTPLEAECFGMRHGQPEAGAAAGAADCSAGIAMREVAFAYGSDRPVLNGLSLDVAPGQVSALVGPSGSGKSTVFKLLLGFYEANAGTIRVAGRDITSCSLTELRAQFAFVPQDAFLFDGTVEDNIRYGKSGADRDEIVAAAMAANAHDFITGLPDGYQTRVGERGSYLSGGQKQRIAIARALMKNAPFLLLDEATSALDTESEHLVQQALERLMAGRTTLVVAHRLSTIQNADEILVIDGGQVVERGKHEELLALNGAYRRLHDTAVKTAAVAPPVAAGS